MHKNDGKAYQVLKCLYQGWMRNFAALARVSDGELDFKRNAFSELALSCAVE
jgi:hypothetical protein